MIEPKVHMTNYTLLTVGAGVARRHGQNQAYRLELLIAGMHMAAFRGFVRADETPDLPGRVAT